MVPTSYSKATLIILLTFLALPVSVFAQFAGGTGSGGDPYQISNCTQLQSMADYKSSSFILIQDIDCSDTVNWNSGSGFLPVGNDYFTTPFTGTFNGDGHVIRDLFINRPGTTGVGLFGWAQGNIQKVGLENVKITGLDRVGAIAGDMAIATVSESFATGTVTAGGGSGGGGLFGRIDIFASATDCYSYVTTSAAGGSNAGGIAGFTLAGLSTGIYDSFSSGPVSGGAYGGISGFRFGAANDIVFSGIYYDSFRAGTTSCDGYNYNTGCTQINSSNSAPNYFFNNNTNAPLNSWDFSTVWKTCPDSFPVFIGGSCTGTLTSTDVQLASLLRGASGNVSVSFTTSRAIPTNGKILVTFPSGFSFNSGGTTAVSGATGIDGSFAVSDAGQVLTLTRSGGSVVAKNVAVSFTLSHISNPTSPGSTGNYGLLIKDGLDVAIDRDDSVAADSIACPSGTYGVSCSACPGGSGSNACSGQGTCDDGAAGSGVCSCASGFASSDCSSCATGFFGASCSQCPGGGNCSGHGSCSEGISGTGACSCSSGYTGSDCGTEIVNQPTLTVTFPVKPKGAQRKIATVSCNVPSGSVAASSYTIVIRGPIKRRNTPVRTITQSGASFTTSFVRRRSYEAYCSYVSAGANRSAESSARKFRLK